MKEGKVNNSLEKKSYAIIGVEILFIILPIIVLIYKNILADNIKWLFYNNEWSIASMIMLGQSIAKMIGALSETKGKLRSGRILSTGSILIMLLIIAVITLDHLIDNPGIHVGVYIFQIIQFFIALFIYLYLGAYWQYRTEEQK
jgi:hypothetical protein